MVQVKEFDLGSKLRDVVSGLEGIATGRLEYLNGCVQYLIDPPLDKDGKLQKGMWVDSQQVEKVGDGIKVAKRSTGGSSAKAPSSFGNTPD